MPGRITLPFPIESRGTAEDVGQDLHVPVGVGGESTAAREVVVVDDPERAEPHVPRIAVVRKGERVPGLQPAMIGMAAVGGFAKGDHRGGWGLGAGVWRLGSGVWGLGSGVRFGIQDDMPPSTRDPRLLASDTQDGCQRRKSR